VIGGDIKNQGELCPNFEVFDLKRSFLA